VCENNLIEFFSERGCAIGPITKLAAIDAGFELEKINQLSDDARKENGTVVTGDWLVLSPAICKMKPPKISNRILPTDQEVLESVSAIDAYASGGDPGCFLDSEKLQNLVQKTRNWDEDTAFLEYLKFLSSSIISGDLSFYSDSPLRTPVGFILTSGKCAEIPLMPEIMRNHTLLVKHFDEYIRASTNAGDVICGPGESMMSMEWHDIANDITNGKNTNAWWWFEFQIIAMGAGWYEGISPTNKGSPRPPICHYE